MQLVAAFYVLSTTVHLNILLQAATSHAFSSFEEVVRDAATLDAALGSQSGTPSIHTSPLLHL